MNAKVLVWLKGLVAGCISGGAGGVVTGFAAMGIDPEHFNLTTGISHVMQIAGISCLMHAILAVAMYLQKSPLPNGGN